MAYLSFTNELLIISLPPTQNLLLFFYHRLTSLINILRLILNYLQQSGKSPHLHQSYFIILFKRKL